MPIEQPGGSAGALGRGLGGFGAGGSAAGAVSHQQVAVGAAVAAHHALLRVLQANSQMRESTDILRWSALERFQWEMDQLDVIRALGGNVGYAPQAYMLVGHPVAASAVPYELQFK